jgi:hypothetical protein
LVQDRKSFICGNKRTLVGVCARTAAVFTLCAQ